LNISKEMIWENDLSVLENSCHTEVLVTEIQKNMQTVKTNAYND